MSWQETEFGKVPSDWDYEPLENYLDLITYGFTNPMPTTPSGVYMVTAKEIFNGRLNLGIARFTSEEAYSELLTDKSRPIKDDVLITKDGSIGRVAIVGDEKICISQSVALMRPNKDRILPIFLKYLLESKQYQALIDIDATGSTIQHIYITKINLMKIAVPASLLEQKAIASVLSSLDDKIDLLHRQNKTLEAMAETLFRQWFIEEAKEDWEYVELGSVVETSSGGTPSRKEMSYYESGSIHWVKSKELNGSFITETEEMITDEAVKRSSAKLLPAYSTLIAMYGATVGEYALITKTMTCNQAVCALKENEAYPYTFIFMYVKNQKDELINQAVGSAQQNISQILIKKLPIPTCIDRINEYHQLVNPWFKRMQLNVEQIQTLENLRDTLLPKLMSGEVRVQYQTEEVA